MTTVTLDNSGKALSVCWPHSQCSRQQAIKLGGVEKGNKAIEGLGRNCHMKIVKWLGMSSSEREVVGK